MAAGSLRPWRSVGPVVGGSARAPAHRSFWAIWGRPAGPRGAGDGKRSADAAPPGPPARPGRRGRPVSVALDSSQINALHEVTGNNRADLREWRFDLRDDLAGFSRMPRLRHCGRWRIAAEVQLRMTDGHAGYAGLETCGSVWVCPVCSAKIMGRRGVEIAAAGDVWINRDGAIAFGTYTIRHHKGHRLADLWDALSVAWSMLRGRGMSARADLEALGCVGWIRTVEVVYSPDNGWHVHVHALWFVSGDVGEVTMARVHGRMVDRWAGALRRQGLDAWDVGQHVELVRGDAAAEAVGKYLAKLPGSKRSAEQLGYEMTSVGSKSDRTEGFTTWDLAAGAAGFKEARAAWYEFERGSKRRRAVTWSRGLRDLLGIGQEVDDETIAAEVMGTEDDAVCSITAEGWTTILRCPGMAVGILRELEYHGWPRVKLILDSFGVEYNLGGGNNGGNQ